MKVKDKPKEEYPKTSPKENKSENPAEAPDLSVLEGWYQFTKDTWRTKRWDFFVIDQFVKGNHNISANPEENTIYVDTPTDYVSYPINKLFANFRSARGFVTRHKPKVEVTPTQLDDTSKTYARRANAVLERDNRLNNFRKINKEWAYYGIKYGVGYRQVGYDKINKVAIRWSIDPFDLGIGAKTGKFEDAPFIIKDIIRTIGYWKNKYPKANVTPDNKTAGDEYKELANQIDNPTSNLSLRQDEQTAIGHEVWYRTYKPNKLGGFINKCLFVIGDILDFVETPYKEYPFVAYESDVSPNSIYPEGHLKHQISPQRLYNLLNMHLLEYNYLVNHGRFQFPKGSGFEVIKAKEGQLIRYNPGHRIESLPPAPINPALQWQIGKADEDMQLIGAYNDASYGKLPTPNASGDLVDALQTGDSNNLLELRENFEDALSQEASLILNMYSLFENKGFVVDSKIDAEQTDKFMVLGDKALGEIKLGKQYIDDNGGYIDYIRIAEDNNVKVSVTSELGETKAARLNILLKLAEAGIIPGKTILDHLEFPNTDDILRRIAEESVAEVATDLMKQPPQSTETTPGGINAQK
jgi:hypothetical protein